MVQPSDERSTRRGCVRTGVPSSGSLNAGIPHPDRRLCSRRLCGRGLCGHDLLGHPVNW